MNEKLKRVFLKIAIMKIDQFLKNLLQELEEFYETKVLPKHKNFKRFKPYMRKVKSDHEFRTDIYVLEKENG